MKTKKNTLKRSSVAAVMLLVALTGCDGNKGEDVGAESAATDGGKMKTLAASPNNLTKPQRVGLISDGKKQGLGVATRWTVLATPKPVGEYKTGDKFTVVRSGDKIRTISSKLWVVSSGFTTTNSGNDGLVVKFFIPAKDPRSDHPHSAVFSFSRLNSDKPMLDYQIDDVTPVITSETRHGSGTGG